MNRLLYSDIFIDFDDTLYDTHGNACKALTEVFAQFGLQQYFATEDDFTQPFWETNSELWSLYAHGKIDRDELIVERIRRPLSLGKLPNGEMFKPSREYCLKMSDFYLERCACKPDTIEGAHEAMQHLKEKGYKLHLCSNGFREVQYKKLHASRMTEYFDTIILSEDAGANKPSKQFFDYALLQTHATQATTLMIGDNFDTDIMGAINSGIHTMFFNRQPNSFSTPHEVDFEIKSLHEIKWLL